MSGEYVKFTNGEGKDLAGLLNRPAGRPKAYAIFAHCFTCGKDLPSARIIAQRLVSHGIAVLRFDFTGLGESEGEFTDTNFSSNIGDLVAAADHLRKTAEAPKLLIGHSLGGAAVLAVAANIPEATAVATIGAPCDPDHVKNLFGEHLTTIEDEGELQVSLVGRKFTIKKQFLDDVSEQKLAPRVEDLRRALLVMHSPTDQTVGIENASRIYAYAKHPKSFISLDGADHLLKRKTDATFAADMLATWALRYVANNLSKADERNQKVLVFETGNGKFQQSLALGRHHLLSDEPVASGGSDSGPSPYEFLLAGLGACTAMTLRLYADRKGIPLDRSVVELKHSRRHQQDGEAACDGKSVSLERIDRKIKLDGNLEEEQRSRLMEIADRCPVHRTLKSDIDIRTTEVEDFSYTT